MENIAYFLLPKIRIGDTEESMQDTEFRKETTINDKDKRQRTTDH